MAFFIHHLESEKDKEHGENPMFMRKAYLLAFPSRRDNEEYAHLVFFPKVKGVGFQKNHS